jgi:hypothetical protein
MGWLKRSRVGRGSEGFIFLSVEVLMGKRVLQASVEYCSISASHVTGIGIGIGLGIGSYAQKT